MSEKCVLCGRKISGCGNNPWPLAHEGLCCDSCNERVVDARIITDIKFIRERYNVSDTEARQILGGIYERIRLECKLDAMPEKKRELAKAWLFKD